MRTRMSCGLAAESAPQDKFQRSSAPGRKFSIMMCAPRARRRTISWPSARRRSQVTDFLLRDCTCHHSEVPLRIRRHLRSASPSPGGSSLITSAPKSPSVLAQKGPAISEPSSTTRMPVSGPDTERYYVRSTKLFALKLFALEQAKRVVFEHRLVALVHHAVGEAHQAAVALGGKPVLDHFSLDVDRVAEDRRLLHIERGVEESEAGVLHGRQEEPLGEGVDERRRHGATLDGAAAIIADGEELLGEPRHVYELREVGLADRAPVRTEAEAEAQILETESTPNDRQGFGGHGCGILY